MESPDPTIPTTGWKLQRVEDLGQAADECVYCHNERVRYVHVLQHPQHDSLRVGCVCAEKLTGDAITPRATENEARNRAKRFATWVDQEHWTIEEGRHTRSGRYVHWDYVVSVFRTNTGWKWLVLLADREFVSTEAFAAPEEAKRHFYTSQLE